VLVGHCGAAGGAVEKAVERREVRRDSNIQKFEFSKESGVDLVTNSTHRKKAMRMRPPTDTPKKTHTMDDVQTEAASGLLLSLLMR
jgi:hypothetical protein